MNRIGRLCIITAALLAIPLASVAQTRGPHASTHELQASWITLPPTESGALSVIRNCDGCAPVSLLTTASTTYEVGDQRVSVAELRAQFALHPNSVVLLILEPDQQHVARVQMAAVPANAR